jgi:hypothetical protein
MIRAHVAAIATAVTASGTVFARRGRGLTVVVGGEEGGASFSLGEVGAVSRGHCNVQYRWRSGKGDGDRCITISKSARDAAPPVALKKSFETLQILNSPIPKHPNSPSALLYLHNGRHRNGKHVSRLPLYPTKPGTNRCPIPHHRPLNHSLKTNPLHIRPRKPPLQR